jgi:hypothetical protein
LLLLLALLLLYVGKEEMTPLWVLGD